MSSQDHVPEPPGGLEDRFARSIEYLRVSITDRCDLRCRYCRPRGGGSGSAAEDAVLNPAQIGRFVSLAVRDGLRKVRLTGGEPLLRPDLQEIIEAIRGSGVRELSLTTNGQRLAEMADELARAGLGRVNISLDSLDPERYRTITRGGDLARVWQGIEAAEAAGLYPVKINMVPMRGVNDDEIARFAELTLEKDCHVRFIECMPVEGVDGEAISADPPRTDEIMKAVSRLGKLHRLQFRGGGPSRNYRLVGARGIIGFISPVSDHFCGSCNRLRLSSTGILRPCLFGREEIDLGSLLRADAPDEAIRGALVAAVRAKPEGHGLSGDRPSARIRSMSGIGG